MGLMLTGLGLALGVSVGCTVAIGLMGLMTVGFGLTVRSTSDLGLITAAGRADT